MAIGKLTNSINPGTARKLGPVAAWLCAAGTAALLAMPWPAAPAAAADAPAAKLTTKEIMKRSHKGDNSLVKKVTAGKGTPQDVTTLLGYYQAMDAQKPPRGDEADWKQRTSALVSATEALRDGKPGALDSLKKAVSCKECHSAHKPESR